MNSMIFLGSDRVFADADVERRESILNCSNDANDEIFGSARCYFLSPIAATASFRRSHVKRSLSCLSRLLTTVG
jgi:hypothetical protein